MKINALRIKKVLHAVLIVLLLSVVESTKAYTVHYDDAQLTSPRAGDAIHYDFSAVCSTGQTLYYRITDEATHEAQLTYPRHGYSVSELTSSISVGTYTYWYGYSEPVGDIVIPDCVEYDGITYSITSIGEHAFGTATENTGTGTACIYVYKACVGITSVLIPSSVTSIGN